MLSDEFELSLSMDSETVTYSANKVDATRKERRHGVSLKFSLLLKDAFLN